MSTTWTQRLLGAVMIVAATLGGQLALVGPASAADVRDRVVRDQSNGFDNILVPDRSAAGAGVRSVPRVGQAGATPPEQTWRQLNQNGGFALAHVPSLGPGRQPLCLDSAGDPATVGARLVLAPCTGQDRQTWRQLSTAIFTQLENRQSKLKAELVGGRLVQNEFPRRGDVDFRERTRLQLFSVVPKEFGVGGA